MGVRRGSRDRHRSIVRRRPAVVVPVTMMVMAAVVLVVSVQVGSARDGQTLSKKNLVQVGFRFGQQTNNWWLVQITTRISFGWFGFSARSKSVNESQLVKPQSTAVNCRSTGQTWSTRRTRYTLAIHVLGTALRKHARLALHRNVKVAFFKTTERLE
ncbi:uncharacterized protein LOC118491103 [Helianthus annuus]|uniref:uncharacterized protein LOC118491103 n=1 Tax=Helianthus annuus TaxID=4232 RepID=UPI001652BC0C|nr:uncharacterized protein LOC118491103 [Helianthus annuus]